MLSTRTGCWSRTERALLTCEQVRSYELPATEGKHGDPRWPAFARRYGFDPVHSVQWQVEALEPDELQRLVLTALTPYVDRDILARQVTREEAQRRALAALWTAGARRPGEHRRRPPRRGRGDHRPITRPRLQKSGMGPQASSTWWDRQYFGGQREALHAVAGSRAGLPLQEIR
ncbi:hypothetical protein ACFYXC_41455 [Streptomyces sp. NPDC002701]|uniref:hypothetical protein n=1 Tax=Streptomyces sp. NPDC002701 TaxID=3364661 RepID=UPI0036BFFFC3